MANGLIPFVTADLVLTPEGRLRASKACREGFERGVELGADVASWSGYWREVFEERSALCEFGGGLTREEAERLAERCVREEQALLMGRGSGSR